MEWNWVLFRLITAALAGSACLFLSAFSYLKNKSRRVNRIFALFNLFVGLWNLSDIPIALAPSPNIRLFIDRLSYIWAIPSIPLFFYLCLEITGIELRRPIFRLLLMVIGTFLISVTFTPWFIKDVDLSPIAFQEVPGVLYPCFVAYLLLTMIYGLYLLFREFRSAAGIRRNQLKYTFLAFLFASMAAISYFATLAIPAIPPLFFILEMIYTGIIAYTIFKYRLMDIRIFLRRAALLVSIYVALLLVVLPLIWFIHKRVSDMMPSLHSYVLTEVFLVSLVLSAAPFLYILFIKHNEYFHEHTMAGLTHELKSPLAAIESALDLLMDQVKKEPASLRQAEYLDMIDCNSARLRKYIDDLLLMMKVGSGRSSLSLTKTHLGDLCSSVVRQFGSAAQAKGVELELKASVNGSRAFCDPAKVEQIISNLLSNAIKFTDRGKITVSIKEDKNTLNVEVTDTGKGIPSNELPYLFDRFYQGEAGRSAKGTGIGLTIAKTWVEAHGGEIHAESDGPGKGSRFWFTLPKG